MVRLTLAINQDVIYKYNHKRVETQLKHWFIDSINIVEALFNPKDMTKNS